MSRFLSELCIDEIGDSLWRLHERLSYESDLLLCRVVVPEGFITDLASVPRVPIAYQFWGGRCPREAVIHDYLYRIDSHPQCSYMLANRVFLEAARARNKAFLVRVPMFLGTVIGGYFSYHKKRVFEISESPGEKRSGQWTG